MIGSAVAAAQVSARAISDEHRDEHQAASDRRGSPSPSVRPLFRHHEEPPTDTPSHCHGLDYTGLLDRLDHCLTVDRERLLRCPVPREPGSAGLPRSAQVGPEAGVGRHPGNGSGQAVHLPGIDRQRRVAGDLRQARRVASK